MGCLGIIIIVIILFVLFMISRFYKEKWTTFTKISLCIPCVPQHIDSLDELLESIQYQTRKPDEIIVGLSEQYDKEIVNSNFDIYGIPVKVVKKGGKAWAGENRNRAAMYSTGDLLIFMDADDLMHPQKIELIEKEYNKGAQTILHLYTQNHEWKQIKKPKVMSTQELRKRVDKSKRREIETIPFITHGHIAVGKSTWDKWKFPEDLRIGEDASYAKTLAKNTKAVVINEKLSLYRAERTTCPPGSECWNQITSIENFSSEPLTQHPKIIISMSLWGKGECYTHGALENAITAPRFYPGAEVWIYHNNTVSKNILKKLADIPYVKLIPASGKFKSMWRFKPMFESDNIVLSRDADSRFTAREVQAVNEWLKSDKDVHIIRDSKHHTYRIMAGMWGVRNGICKKFLNKYLHHRGNASYGADQLFLSNMIYPDIKSNIFVHDNFQTFEDETPHKLYIPSIYHIGAILCDTPEAEQILGVGKKDRVRNLLDF